MIAKVCYDISCKGASPQERLARPPGADKGGAAKVMCFRATPPFAVHTRLHHLCRCQAALHGASGATSSQMACPQRHRATMHHLITWRVTELYGAHGVEVGEDAAKIVPAGSDRLKCRDAECADTAFVGARRPCKVLLWRRART